MELQFAEMNTQSSYRVLVIDPDESLRGVYSCMLPADGAQPDQPGLSGNVGAAMATASAAVQVRKDIPGFELDFASDWEEGLEKCREAATESPYVMAFVDAGVSPTWNGIRAISRMLVEFSEMQLVVCLGSSDFSWYDLEDDLGYNDRLLVLKKPFDTMEFRQAACCLASKWDLAHKSQSDLRRLQRLVNERTAKLQEANLSLQNNIAEMKPAEHRLMTQYLASQALARAKTLDEAMESVFHIVCTNLDFDWGAMWELDVEANVLKIGWQWNIANRDLDDFTKTSRVTLLERGGGLPGRVWNTGREEWVQDITLDTDFRRSGAQSQHGLRTAAGIPIYCGTRMTGVMEFISRGEKPVDAELLRTFVLIGSSVGQFIERKQAEDDLKRQRDYVDQIIRESPALVVGVAPDGRTTFANPAVAFHTEYPAEELIGKNWWQTLYPGDASGQVTEFFGKLKEGPVHDHEMILTTRSGAKRTVSWNSLAKYNHKGELVELIGFGNDITQRKKAEAEKNMMELHMRRAQKLESIGQLAAGIAHEINTPTQYLGDNIRFLQTSFADLRRLHGHYESILTAARENRLTHEVVAETEELIKQSNFAFLLDEIPQAIDQSLEGVKRVARIVRAMKDFSHPGATEKTRIDLNRAIETTLIVAANEWKYVAEIETQFDPKLPPVVCHPGELNQVILNLVVNAAHAIADVVDTNKGEKGIITATTKLCGEWAEIRIRDTGTGIPEKIRDRIFDPFFTTKPVGKGTGQGLAIAHSVVVDQHGGRLNFETEVGKGTEFVIRLPLNPPPKDWKKGRP